MAEAKKVLDKAGEKYGHSFTYQDILMGGCSIDATGVPLTDEAIAAAKAGKHIICEKPLALTVDQAREMYLTAKENNIKNISKLKKR